MPAFRLPVPVRSLLLALLLAAPSRETARAGLLEEPLAEGDWTRPLILALEPGTALPATRGEAATRIRRRLERDEPDPDCRIGLLAEAYRLELTALGLVPAAVRGSVERVCPPLPVSPDAGETHRTGRSRIRLQKALLELDRLDRRIADLSARPPVPPSPAPAARLATSSLRSPPPAPPSRHPSPEAMVPVRAPELDLWSPPSLLNRPDPEGWSPLFAPPPVAPRSP